jgi:hypothetical protein
MSRNPNPEARLVAIVVKREELASLVEAIDRPGAKAALGLHTNNRDHPDTGDTGKALRRAVNALTAAEAKAKVDDARALAVARGQG